MGESRADGTKVVYFFDISNLSLLNNDLSLN